MTKGEFAALIGVSPSRVSQYLAAGIIGRDALVGEGRSAKIKVDVAIVQVGRRRHVGQALGNGLMTRLRLGDTRPAVAEVAEQLLRERLIAEQRRNRMAEIDEAVRSGQLVPVAEYRRWIGKALQRQMSAATSTIFDIANAVAALDAPIGQAELEDLIRRVIDEKVGPATARIRADALQELTALSLHQGPADAVH